MSATKTELTGGNFQDSEGDPLDGGYLTLRLSQDCTVAGVGNICSGVEITITLDSNGNAAAGQYVWSNLVMSPLNNYYRVTGYTAEGQKAWGPNNQQVASGSTFNLDSWTPNTVISWFPATQSLLLEVNGVQASSQVVQNLTAGSGVTITDEGGGVIEFASSGVSLEVNGTPNADQSLLNLTAGTNVTITDGGGGTIQIAASGASFSGNGTYFYGPGITDLAALNNANATNGGVMNVASGVVVVYLFELFSEFTVSKASIIALGNSIGVHGYFGIYSLTGNKLVDGGQFNNLTTGPVQTNTFTAVTLPPGLYWHAHATNTTNSGQYVGIPANTNMYALLTKNNTRAAYAANALSGGALPATLGALTPFVPTTSNGGCVFCPLYE